MKYANNTKSANKVKPIKKTLRKFSFPRGCCLHNNAAGAALLFGGEDVHICGTTV